MLWLYYTLKNFYFFVTRAAVNVVDFDEKYIVSASGDRTIKVNNILIIFIYIPLIFYVLVKDNEVS